MRISEQQRYRITTDRVANARSSNAALLEKLSTLKSINRISDDPVGAGQVVRANDRIANLQQFQRNIDFSKGFLERTETALTSMSENLMRTKEIAINLANAPFDADSRQAAAMEVDQIISQLVTLGNSSYLNKYVFSGFRSATPSLSDEGEYLGDDGALYVQIDDHNLRRINLQARYLFEASPDEREAGHFSMIDSLKVLHSGLATDDVHQIRKAMDELDHQIEKTTSFQAKLGSLYSALDNSHKALQVDEELSRNERSKINEIDMFQSTADFHRSEAMLQSTLLASNKMLQPSLLNFMQ